MKTLYSLFVLSLFAINTNAQFYSQGDISVVMQPSVVHDSTQCYSIGQLFYQITIQNSFVGDTVRVIDEAGGFIVSQDVNTTGQTPWMVMAPIPTAGGYLMDHLLVNDYAGFGAGNTKVISGTDTIYNIMNFYGQTIPDACEYGDISGRVYADYNNNCVFDGSDAPVLTVATSQIWVNSPAMNQTSNYAYTDGNGNYTMAVQESWMTNYNVTLPQIYQFIFPSSGCAPAMYNFSTTPQTGVDFPLGCSGSIDVISYIGSPGSARPAIPFNLTSIVNNIGCDTVSGTLTLVLDPNVTYNPALSIYPASTVSGDTLTWQYYNLNNLSAGGYWNSFISNVHLTPDTNINIGDTLCFQVYTNVPTNDINAWNNEYSICIPVVNSYDPNMKEVTPRGVGAEGNIPQNTNELTYTVHFQNTGNASAMTVSIIDTLESDIEVGSLRIVGASHFMQPEWLSNNVVKFTFSGINLPDSTSNEPASHGFVTFKVKPVSNLPIGTQIKNTGYIYFDFNPAIVTNTTLNTIAEPNSISTIENDLVAVYPNPANTSFFVNNFNTTSNGYDIRIENYLGQVVYTTHATQAQQIIDANSFAKGVYTVHVIDTKSNTSAVKKIVVQ